MKKKRAKAQKLKTSTDTQAALPTFLDHVHELRSRLFWVVGIVLASSAAAYPFLDKILSVLTAPLGGQQLYYLTPVGGLSFSIKICLYVGIIFATPAAMYHVYRFIEPLMRDQLRRSAFFYGTLSLVSAISGVVFAYLVLLPSALHFLTGMDLRNIQAMLTVDSYLSFVMTYLLGGALLFQIPLVLLTINTFTPLPPKKLMGMQRYVIVAAFIIAAVVSPTPDVMNQVFFALPIIVMYELGVVLIWMRNRRLKRAEAKIAVVEQAPVATVASQSVVKPYEPAPAPVVITRPAPQPRVARVAPVDGFVVSRNKTQRQLLPTPIIIQAPKMRQMPLPKLKNQRGTRSVDGFAARRVVEGEEGAL